MKHSEFVLLLRELNLAAEILLTCTDKLSKAKLYEEEEEQRPFFGSREDNFPVRTYHPMAKKLPEPEHQTKVKPPTEYDPRDGVLQPSGIKREMNRTHLNAGKAWTEEEKEKLRKFMEKENFSFKEVTNSLGRSKSSINTMMVKIRKGVFEQAA